MNVQSLNYVVYILLYTERSYLANGTLAKLTECRKLAKSGDHWGMEELTVESAAPGHHTNLDFSKGSRDIEVPATDFTPEGIARLLQE